MKIDQTRLFNLNEDSYSRLVKSQQQIFRRLNKLYLRYLKRYVELTQKRACLNCVHGGEHITKPLCYSSEPPSKLELYPTHVSSVVIVDPEPGPVQLCMYGSEDPAKWEGNLCTEEIAKSCKLFEPRISIKLAKINFDDLMNDDEYVLKHYNDIATLQWTLDDRITKHLSWWDRFLIWCWRIKPDPIVPQLPPPEIPEGFWNDSPPNSGT